MSSPVEIGRGIAVETEGMLRAAGSLGDARSGLQQAARRTRALAAEASPRVAARLHDAADRVADAERQAEAAADGLRVAAHRYGWTERAVAQAQQTLFAAAAALEGGAVSAGFLPVLGLDAAVSGGFLLTQALEQWRRTGAVAPQSDPEVVRWLQLRLSSLDDGLRAFVGLETGRDLVVDDPSAALGTEAIGAAVAALLWPVARPIEVRRTVSRRTDRPASLAELGDRLPDGAERQGQIRIERYDGPDGRRWIVYSAGTVTFDVDSGSEPFDLESDVRGVADRPADAQRAVLEAMRQAGIGADEPVLMVGHSQGALNVIRIAEDGEYDVAGVVEFGGPTEQIPAPPGVDVLQVVHAQDLVPALGGVAAVSGAGTVTVGRALPDSAVRPRYGTGRAVDAFPAHDMAEYRRTIAQAEAVGSPEIEGLRRRWSGFFDGGPGESTRYAARRLTAPVSAPGPSRTADAAPGPPASR